ncbi:MAG: DsrE family protein [Gammaproteobacteria bacterium]
MRIAISLILLGSLTCPAIAEPVSRPIIQDFGPVYYIPEKPLDLPPDTHLKAVFDIAATPAEIVTLNYRLETVARYLNMHARAGVAFQQVSAAVVLHGRATRSALGEQAFNERFGGPNPDSELLRQLNDAGVRIVVCGQSAAALGFGHEEFAAHTEISLSAMTALVMFQADGFALIPWGTE